MAVTIKNRVMQTTLTSGVGNYVLASPVMGYRTFANGFSDQELLYYAINDGDDNWEVGVGRYVFGTDSIVRVTILDSSTGGAAISWPGGGVSKNIYAVIPSEKSIYRADDDTVENLTIGSGFTTKNAVVADEVRTAIGIGEPIVNCFLMGNATNWVTTNPANVRFALGIGNPALNRFLVGGASSWITTNADGARTALGIGAPALNQFLLGTANAWASANAATARTALGIGAPTNGNLLVGNGSAWIANTPSQARVALGIGTPTNGNFLVGNGSGWGTTNPTNARIALGLPGTLTNNRFLYTVGGAVSLMTPSVIRGDALRIRFVDTTTASVAANGNTKLTLDFLSLQPIIGNSPFISVNVVPNGSHTNRGRFEAYWVYRGNSSNSQIRGNASGMDTGNTREPPSSLTMANSFAIDIYNWSNTAQTYNVKIMAINAQL